MSISYYLVMSDSEFKAFKNLTLVHVLEVVLLTVFCVFYYLSQALESGSYGFIEDAMIFSLLLYQACFILSYLCFSTSQLSSFGRKIFIPKTLVFYKSILVSQSLYLGLNVEQFNLVKILLFAFCFYVLVSSCLSSLSRSSDRLYPGLYLVSQLVSVLLISLAATNEVFNILFYVLILDSVINASFIFSHNQNDNMLQSVSRKPEYFLFLLNSLFFPISISFIAKIYLIKLFVFNSEFLVIGFTVALNHLLIMVMGIRQLSKYDLIKEFSCIGKKNLGPSPSKVLYLSCVIISTCLLVFI